MSARELSRGRAAESTCKAVFFDVGSTLLDPEPGIDGVFAEVASKLGYAVSAEEADSHMGEIHTFYEAEYLKDGDFWCSPAGSVEIYLDMYRYLAHLCGLGKHADEIARGMYELYLKPEYWRVYDDVRECLNALKGARYHLAVVSNWAPYLTNLLRGLKLAPYFDEVIASADVGYRKPDPMIFTIAMERMGVLPEEVVHVGDRPDADGDGAIAAGIRPVIIDRFGWYEDTVYQRISHLGDLAPLL